jgi:hypothetical protein
MGISAFGHELTDRAPKAHNETRMEGDTMRIASSVIGFTFVIAACANGSTADDPNGAKPAQENAATITDDLSTLDRFCLAVGHAACSDAVVKGCGAPSADACVKARTAACNRDVPQGTTYIAANALACVTAIKVANDDGTLTADEVGAIDKACGPPIFSGPGEARAPCTTPYDCRSDIGLDCIITLDAQVSSPTPQGKCMKPNNVPMGKSCTGEADVCAPDAFCDQPSHTCKARGVAGQSCHPTLSPCAPGTKCPGASPFGQTCMKLKAAGDPCKDGSECESTLCDRAKGQSDGNCADQIQLTAIDAACADFLGDASQ